MSKLKALFVIETDNFELIYGDDDIQEIHELVDVYAPVQTEKSAKANPSILNDAEVIISGWGAPILDKSFLDAAKNLKAFFYGGGSIKDFVTDSFWERNIIISSAYAANAVPVAEYTISQILFCLKRGWHYALSVKQDGKYIPHTYVPGGYKSTVGIISLGMIGRKVCELLKNFDLNIIAYDPFVSEKEAAKLGVELCTLEKLFSMSDVVSLHAPWLPETEGLIKGDHFKLMKQNSSFINTSRGAIVCENEMIEVLKNRNDVFAILDVTHPEPPEPGSPLYSMPNIVVTPHIAGSMAGECKRMGRYMADELRRYVNGEELIWSISKEKAAILA